MNYRHMGHEFWDFAPRAGTIAYGYCPRCGLRAFLALNPNDTVAHAAYESSTAWKRNSAPLTETCDEVWALGQAHHALQHGYAGMARATVRMLEGSAT